MGNRSGGRRQQHGLPRLTCLEAQDGRCLKGARALRSRKCVGCQRESRAERRWTGRGQRRESPEDLRSRRALLFRLLLQRDWRWCVFVSKPPAPDAGPNFPLPSRWLRAFASRALAQSRTPERPSHWPRLSQRRSWPFAAQSKRSSMAPLSLSTIAVGVWVAVLCWALAYLCFPAPPRRCARCSPKGSWPPRASPPSKRSTRPRGGERALVVTLLVGATLVFALFPVALGPRRS